MRKFEFEIPHMFPIFPLLAVCFWLMPLPALAQAQPEAPRTCRLLFVGVPKEVPAKLFLFDGTNVHPVEAGRMSFSPVYRLPAGHIRIALLSSPPPIPAAGQLASEIPNLAPSAAIPESTTDFYLFLSSDPTNPVLPLKIQVVNAGMTEFSQGSMLWFNLTENTVGGILGSKKLRIAPHSRIILEPPTANSEDYYVNVHYVRPGENHSEPLCETRWQHDPRSRTVFFVLKDSSRASPRILGISDFRTEEEAVAPAP